ncbi:histidine kinase [Sphingomonas changnyeongensis]|uniref:Histidine kinase n=1 Tax=Sphingomonas changnyeongensis TaxID=2698679 RepID=A0A7Z2S9R1_9SPHN|nr:histidine kinase [Sphingomonas changnyeongensis]QHL91034.1 histidine kinase [Sphingomonas changnyeongensis]
MIARLSTRLSPTRLLPARLSGNAKGVAYIEFAFSLPAFMGLSMYGIEVGNYAQMQMRVSQIALSLADNASRAGSSNRQTNLQELREVDLSDVLEGVRIQGGSLRLLQNGRVTLSSVETNASGGQTIKWQRCLGLRQGTGWDSSYGRAGDGATGNAFAGMGPTGSRVTAPPGSAVMFVEINYQYQPLLGAWLIGRPRIHYIASFVVRDRRDLSLNSGTGIIDPAPSIGNARLTCDKYTV